MKHTINIVGIAVVIYALLSFMLFNANPAKWSEQARFFLVLFWLAGVMIYMLNQQFSPKTKP